MIWSERERERERVEGYVEIENKGFDVRDKM